MLDAGKTYGEKEKEKESRVRESGVLRGREGTGCGITFSGQGKLHREEETGTKTWKKVRVRAQHMGRGP